MSRMTRQERAREARLADYDQRVEAAIAQGHGRPEAIEKATRLAPRTVDQALTRLRRAGRIRFSLPGLWRRA
jgi:hypothetical protein